MRSLFFLCVCVYVVAGQNVIDMANMPKYDERYDYLDVDALFNSKRLVRNYVDCLINASRCTPEGKALKRILPEALRTKCIRCTERQKKTAVKVIKRLKYEYPEEWAKLSTRWDPTGDFTRYFEEFLAKEHFNTILGSAGNEIPGSSPPSPPPPPSLPPLTDAPPMLTNAPPMLTNPPPSQTYPPQSFPSTSPRPVILNRFGDDGELMMGSPSSAAGTTPPTMRPISTTNMRPMMQPRPTMIWTAAASDSMPTRFPLRPNKDMSPPYTTAITLIDQIGYKIIRTTELVTDILRNTVRAVVGR
ncbi:formin-1-like [Plodia interpunctella]|uniref:formin-1-like n=1 Tax=Plodia interpunctella TaxID=58824 RepID=UPI0023687683|nr:formin-1-like [Plodia interpunctella]